MINDILHRHIVPEKHVIGRVWIVNIGRRVFVQLTLVPNLQNPVLYNAFESAKHPQYCAFQWGRLDPI